MLLREARLQGVKHMIVTHAMIAPIRMSIPQMHEAAELGAYIEFVYNGLIGPNKIFEFADYTKAIRSLDPGVCILATDLGRAVNPLHPDGMEAFLAGLKSEGFTDVEIAPNVLWRIRPGSWDERTVAPSFLLFGATHYVVPRVAAVAAIAPPRVWLDCRFPGPQRGDGAGGSLTARASARAVPNPPPPPLLLPADKRSIFI